MIEYLRGKVVQRYGGSLILDVGGVGYGIEMPLSNLCELAPSESEQGIFIYTKVKEDSIKLFGFLTQSERQSFEILLGINGVGPKVALAILSTLSPRHLLEIVSANRLQPLTKVPGVGKKTAERILLELKSKRPALEQIGGATDRSDTSDLFHSQEMSSLPDYQTVEEVKSALTNLGFNGSEIDQFIGSSRIEDGAGFAAIMKSALTYLSSGMNKGSRLL